MCIFLLGGLIICLPAKLVVYKWKLKTLCYKLIHKVKKLPVRFAMKEGQTLANEISQTQSNRRHQMLIAVSLEKWLHYPAVWQ